MPEVKAIYEHGVFKPLQELEIPDGQHIRLVVETSEVKTSEDMRTLAAQIYEELSPEDVDAIEEIACTRRNFFGEAMS